MSYITNCDLEGNSAEAELALDGKLDTFWFANCGLVASWWKPLIVFIFFLGSVDFFGNVMVLLIQLKSLHLWELWIQQKEVAICTVGHKSLAVLAAIKTKPGLLGS